MEPGQDWPELIPLDSTELPRMPVDALPSALRDYALVVSAAEQSDPALPAVIGLGAIAALAQKTCKAKGTDLWRPEPLCLNVIALADSGERKSPVAERMCEALPAIEEAIADQGRLDRVMRNEQRESLRRQHEAARKEAGKTSDAADSEGSRSEAAQLAMQLHELGDYVETDPRLVVDNVTPEECVTLMARSGGRITVISPEGAFLHVMKGAYSRNQEPADLSALLSAYSGDRIRVDRKSRAPESVPSPAASLILIGQPVIFEELCQIKGAEDRGLIARFIIANIPGRYPRKLKSPDAAAPESSPERAAWEALLWALSRRPVSDYPPVLRLSPEAEAYLERWHDDELEHERGPEGGKWSLIRAFAKKAHGLALRFAGLFHLCEHPEAREGELIDLDTMQRAVTVAEWALASHRAAVVRNITPEPVKHARALVDKARGGSLSVSRKAFKGQAWAPFTERDVRIALGGGNKPVDSERAKLPLEEVLEPYGYIRWSRDLAAYEWHPDLAAGGEQ